MTHALIKQQNEIKRLEEENKALKTKIAMLEEDLAKAEVKAESVETPVERFDISAQQYNRFGLTKSEMRLFMRLLERPEGATRPSLMNALYNLDGDKEYYVDPKIIDVYLCKIRRKITAQGEFDGRDLVKTVWGVGYCINPRLRPRLLEMTGFDSPA